MEAEGRPPTSTSSIISWELTTTTIQDYSATATAAFKPTQGGVYTLYVQVKDAGGQTSIKSISNYVVHGPVKDIHTDYRTHVQNVGWQSWKEKGDMSGTSVNPCVWKPFK